MADKDGLIIFLRNISFDVPVDAGYKAWSECDASGEEDDSCSGDCGKCRYEYMKSKGWLNPEVTK